MQVGDVDRSSAAGSEGSPRAPWYVSFFFGRDARLEPSRLRLLGLVSLGLFFENYDVGLLNAALPQIARELGIPAESTGYYLSAIRLGGLGSFLLLPLADRIGRRRVFLVAVVGMSFGTLATGLCATSLQFAAAQLVTRIFMLTGLALAVVILVEEMPARHRGAALGMLSVLGGMGYGLSAGLYAAVEWLPHGWRSLYLFGVVPALVVPWLRRELHETSRFQAYRSGRSELRRAGPLREWLAPIRRLTAHHPGRTAAVGLAGLFTAMGGISLFQYTSYFVQTAHGWSPAQYTLLVFGGGLLGLMGNVLGGRGSDRLGRRGVGFACLVLAPAGAALFFLGPTSTLVLAWGTAIFCLSAGELVVRALAAELFPTSERGTSGGWLIFVQTLGWSLGLLLVGVGTSSDVDLGRAVSLVSLSTVLAAVCMLFVPATHRRELEAI